MMYDQECRLERNVGLKSIYTCVTRRVPCTLLGQMPPSLLTNEKKNNYIDILAVNMPDPLRVRPVWAITASG